MKADRGAGANVSKRFLQTVSGSATTGMSFKFSCVFNAASAGSRRLVL